ncbi:MAG: prephenate dehydratase [Planctomycetota bacterium]|nr:MAG: prephenate dehydratase [Planctomycetota bacterium]
MAKKTTRKKTAAKKKKTTSGPVAAKRKPTTPRGGKRPTAAAIRRELQRLDRQILELINRRAELTTELIQQSENPRREVYNFEADAPLYEALAERNRGPLPDTAVRGVFRQILSAARHAVRVVRVAYLGPQYSFTHLAAVERFGESADLIPVGTIAAVFEEVNRGHAEFGVVPIENSTDGRIVDTLDMLTRLPLKICGEIQLAIHHNLLARCPREQIVEIYSKPQALSQCRDWLARNMPQARLVEVTSTSTAARLARDKPGAAAIASRQAAVEYGLQIVVEDVQDNKNNVTRFAVIGHEQPPPTGNDRTSLLLQVPHQPGALADALAVFKKNKVNLTWIESFPLRGEEVGYLFFLDFEGHSSETRIARTLKQLEPQAVRMVVLGSYPRAEVLD